MTEEVYDTAWIKASYIVMGWWLPIPEEWVEISSHSTNSSVGLCVRDDLT